MLLKFFEQKQAFSEYDRISNFNWGLVYLGAYKALHFELVGGKSGNIHKVTTGMTMQI